MLVLKIDKIILQEKSGLFYKVKAFFIKRDKFSKFRNFTVKFEKESVFFYLIQCLPSILSNDGVEFM